MAGRNLKLVSGGKAERIATPRPAGKDKRQSKRDAVLAEAAATFNARGIAGTSINDIAAKLELTRAALYYYVDDRDDLVFQTYMRSCELTADDLEAAYESGRNGLTQLLAYVERALDPERAPAAVLSEISYLSGSARSMVEKAQRRNVQALERFVREGIADRSMRACDDAFAAQSVVGLVSWAPLSPAWIGEEGNTARNFRKSAAAAVIELLRDGIAADPKAKVACPINVETFRPRAANMFDRRDAAAMKMDQIAMTASKLFSRHGIDGTSLDQISEALGATKGVLYHYFADKEALVTHCYRRGFSLFEQFVETAARAGSTGLERAMIGIHFNTQAQAGLLSPLMPQAGIDALPARFRAELTKRARTIEETFESFGDLGRADGTLRDCDLETIALVGAGVFGWIPKWRERTDAAAAWTIADDVVELFIRGLRRR
jgi:AcrR family transcriptional regulator